MIDKNGNDVPIEKLTKETYLVPKGEEGSYHCVIEVVQFDQKTGKRLSVPRIQKFGKKSFESHIESSLRKQGYTITILHDPNDWLKEQAKKRAEAAKKAEEEKAKAEEAKAQAEKERIDKLVAERVAEELKKQNKGSGDNKTGNKRGGKGKSDEQNGSGDNKTDEGKESNGQKSEGTGDGNDNGTDEGKTQE